MGTPLHLDKPKTFNEKLQWLKLNNKDARFIKMVDKYDVKEYVASVIGNEYIIPTLAIYKTVEEIDFSTLPKQFVLKCTHDSGGLVVCKDISKLDKNSIKKKLQKSLKRNYFWRSREWPYKNVKPRILAEKYMVDDSGYELKDYKFFCFGGKCRFFKIDFDRYTDHHANYYDCDAKLLPFGEADMSPIPSKKIEIPSNLKEMVAIAEKLSADIKAPFVRIDLYNIHKRIYFGEITFFPASGMGKIVPQEWDEKLGNYIENVP